MKFSAVFEQLWSLFLKLLPDNRFRRAVIVFFCVLLTWILVHRTHGAVDQLLLTGAGILAIISFASLEQTIFLVLLGIFCVVERHFIAHYGDGMAIIGQQALLTLQITDKEEVITYLSDLYFAEYLLAAIFITAAVLVNKWRGQAIKPLKFHLSSLAWIFLASWIAHQAIPPVRGFWEQREKQKSLIAALKNFRFDARDKASDTPAVYLLVIGESHRFDHLESDLLCEAAAPGLHQAMTDGNLFRFDDVISFYPQTWFSVFTLLTRRNPDNTDSSWHERSLFWLFREAGYHVTYLTYQPRTIALSGYDGAIGDANEYINHRQSSHTNMDKGMLPILAKLLKAPHEKHLIAIKMVGCHFRYPDRYTDEYRKFTPDFTEENFKLENTPDAREKLRNSYRNAVRYSGSFLEEAARMIGNQTRPGMMIFLSDHGIGNYDDGENAYFGKAQSGYHIPFFIYPNQAWRERYLTDGLKQTLLARRNEPISNRYLFDTLVSLAQLEYPGQRAAYDLTSDKFTPEKERKVWVWNQQLDYQSLVPEKSR